MNHKVIITSVFAAVCFGSFWLVGVQRQEVVSLRAEQQQLQTGAESQAANPPSAPAADQRVTSVQSEPPLELLKLRSEVTQLMGRQRELANVTNENARLRAQLESRRTNTTAAATPESTIQSFLLAMKQGDFTNYLQTLTPASAQRLMAQAQRPEFLDEFKQLAKMFPNMRIASQEKRPDGTVAFEIELVPGQPAETLHLRQVGGEWKVETP